jgi:hypothetical protein
MKHNQQDKELIYKLAINDIFQIFQKAHEFIFRFV